MRTADEPSRDGGSVSGPAATNAPAYDPADDDEFRDVFAELDRRFDRPGLEHQARTREGRTRWDDDVPPPEHGPGDVDLPPRAPAMDSRPPAGPVLVRLADVRPEPVQWLWTRRIALGTMTILSGDPGLGKSTLALDIAARVSTGRAMPGDGTDVRCEPAGVVILNAEDSLAMTTRPRLDAHGADVDRIVAVTATRDGEGRELHVDLGRDLDAVEAAIDSVGARLVIVDPISAYLGSANSWRDSEIRGVLGPLAALADRRRVAVVSLLHLTKATDRAAIYRGQGSIAFVAAARVMLAVGVHPEDHERPLPEQRRVLACAKSNLAPAPPSLVFAVGKGPIAWGEEIEATADALLGPRPSGRARSKVDLARTALAETLADGRWHEHADVYAAVRDRAGCADDAIDRARRALRVEHRRVGFGAGGRVMLRMSGATHRGSDAEYGGEAATPPCEPDFPYSATSTHAEYGQTATDCPSEPVQHTPYPHHDASRDGAEYGGSAPAPGPASAGGALRLVVDLDAEPEDL